MEYSKRHWTHQGFHFIQPFVDVQGELPLVELFLDNNAFIRLLTDVSLLDGLKALPGIKGYLLNPSIALAEQWLSNPAFRLNANDPDPLKRGEMIEKFVRQAATRGIAFADGYSRDMIAACKREEAGLRYMAGVLFAYIAVIRALQRRKMSSEERRVERFSEFVQGEVPKFSGLIALAALTFASLTDRKLAGKDGKAVVSLIDRFFAPKGDEPEHLTLEYLRNRAMDLLCWYWMPHFARGYLQPVGVFPIVVTRDRFLAGVPFRYILPLRSQHQEAAISLGVWADDMNPSSAELYYRLFDRLRVATGTEAVDEDRKRELLDNLYEAARVTLEDSDLAGFDESRRWVTPLRQT